MMTIRDEWYHCYGKQRAYRGKAIVIARSQIVTEALRKVIPPVRRVVHSRMNSGRPASYLTLEPPR